MMRRASNAAAALARLWPGTALTVVLALAATFVSSMHGGPTLLYALFFGVSFHYLSKEPRTRPGIDLCSRTVLRLGVGLLGARITAAQIVALGWPTALTVVVAVVSTISLGAWLAPRLGLARDQGVLSGGSVAICGASAALAISAVLPRTKDSDRFTLLVVVSVTALSTVAMVLYPLLARWLGLPPALAGLFIGGSIHDVAQVVGAGYTMGPETGDVATVVKLMRVAMLSVVVLVLSMALRRAHDEAAARAGASGNSTDSASGDAAAPAAARPPLLPWFLWLFLALVAINSAGVLPAPVQSGLADAARACLVVAIAALGTKTSIGQLAAAGWRPMALILAETVFLALLVLGVIVFMR
jgi:uncharacterized integral membrane protein (TIGR00698 family)